MFQKDERANLGTLTALHILFSSSNNKCSASHYLFVLLFLFFTCAYKFSRMSYWAHNLVVNVELYKLSLCFIRLIESRGMNLTFREKCIVMYSHNKTNEMH
jgi:hypothetical protein